MAGITPQVAREIETVAELKAFVMADEGIAMIPPLSAAPEAAAAQLTLVELSPPVPLTKIAYAYDAARMRPAVTVIRGVPEEVSREAFEAGLGFAADGLRAPRRPARDPPRRAAQNTAPPP